MSTDIETPAGKYLLASDFAFQVHHSYRIHFFIAKAAPKALPKSDFKKAKKAIEEAKQIGERNIDSLKLILAKIDGPSALDALLRKSEEAHANFEDALSKIESLPESSPKKAYMKLVSSLQALLSIVGEAEDLVEARLAEVIRQNLTDRAVNLEAEKGEVSEPDEEAWEELRRHGEEAKYLPWKTIKGLD